MLPETCDGIWEALKKTYVCPLPSTKEWIGIGKEFEEWNFPNRLGTVDGKHIKIKCPQNARSTKFNVKAFHSIVLLEICHARYCFTFVDICSLGGENGASILANSNISRSFDNLLTIHRILCATSHGEQSLWYALETIPWQNITTLKESL